MLFTLLHSTGFVGSEEGSPRLSVEFDVDRCGGSSLLGRVKGQVRQPLIKALVYLFWCTSLNRETVDSEVVAHLTHNTDGVVDVTHKDGGCEGI